MKEAAHIVCGFTGLRSFQFFEIHSASREEFFVKKDN
jgi:hypothetical protein